MTLNNCYQTSTTAYLLLLLTLLCIPQTVFGQEAPELFTLVNEDALSLSTKQNRLLNDSQARPTSKHVRLVRIPNVTKLSTFTQVALNVAPETRLLATQTNIERRGRNEFTWVGKLDAPASQVLIVVNDEKVTGLIQTGSVTYLIEPLGEKLHALIEVDQSQYLPDETPESGERDDRPEDASFGEMGIDSMNKTTSGGSSEIDLLVVYTSAAASSSGDINGLIQGAVDITNTSIGNSNISSASVNLVHKTQVSYSESGNSATDVNRLQNPSDGYMDNVHDLRDQYAADVVVLIVSSSNACGRVYAIGGATGTFYEDEAFAIVKWDCAVGNYSFAHEIGHLLGARHNISHDPSTSPYPWGHGYNYASGNWRTIMSVDLSLDRIAYWSNPDKTLGGVSMGTYDDEDNARVWEETIATVADFRTLPAPTSLTVTGSTGQHPYLTWNASVGATGYKVYRCTNIYPSCSSFTLITTTSNTYYTDTQKTIGTQCGTGPDEIAHYYVTAYDADEESDPSNTANHCLDANKNPSLASVPETFILKGNFPNPFNPTTTISMDLPEAAEVRVEVIDVLGRVVLKTPVRKMDAGANRSVEVNASSLASGAYVYRVIARTAETAHVATGRLTLVK